MNFQRIRRWAHDKLGDGYPVQNIGGDSFQPVWSCRYCNGTLAQDSQGNWFHLSGKELAPHVVSC